MVSRGKAFGWGGVILLALAVLVGHWRSMPKDTALPTPIYVPTPAPEPDPIVVEILPPPVGVKPVFVCRPTPSAYYIARDAGDAYLSLPIDVLNCAELAAYLMRKAEERIPR
jgi:hypothetical protein